MIHVIDLDVKCISFFEIYIDIILPTLNIDDRLNDQREEKLTIEIIKFSYHFFLQLL